MKVERNQLQTQIMPPRTEGRETGDRVNGSPDATRDEGRKNKQQRRSYLEELVIQEQAEEQPKGQDAPPPSRDKGSGLNITV
jgi:hypothetical protein